jgi:hypothetical protein
MSTDSDERIAALEAELARVRAERDDARMVADKKHNMIMALIGLKDELRAENDRLRHDTQAYRGALGYPVPGEYNGLLSNGELPQCGLCAGRENELRHLRSERDALQRQIEGRAWDHFEPGFVDVPASEDYPGELSSDGPYKQELRDGRGGWGP